MVRQYSNGYASVINTGPTAGATSTAPASVTGIPATPFDARIRNMIPSADGLHFAKEEIVSVTNVSGGTLTLSRASQAIYDGTQAAVDFSSGAAVIEQVFTMGAVEDLVLGKNGGLESVSTDGAVGSSKVLDWSIANEFYLTLTQAVAFSFSNVPNVSGKAASIVITLIGAYASTWPTVTWVTFAPAVVTPQVVVIWTPDGGTTFFGAAIGG